MSSAVLGALSAHLWQSTLFTGVAGILTLLARRNSARVRYLLWLAASAKFLVPCALLAAVGAQIPWSAAPVRATQGSVVWIAGQLAGQLAALAPAGEGAPVGSHPAGATDLVVTALLGIWALGTLGVVAVWLARLRDVRRLLQGTVASDLPFIIPVRASTAQVEPAVVGILHPVLVLPQGIDGYLTPGQLHAVLAHERCHVRWRDNLAGALHMLVEALFWFHPLVWWLGARLVAERERACDEQVIAEGHAGETYAEGILRVCERFLSARLACVAGVGGTPLPARIEAILKNGLIERLSGARKLVIAAVTCAAIAAPVAVGALTSQARATPADFEPGSAYRNVSIRLTPPKHRDRIRFLWTWFGRLDIENLPPRALIAQAYGVTAAQVVGRDFGRDPTYDITAEGPVPWNAGEPGSAAMQDLLARHFGLAVRPERRRMQGYVLTTGSAGPRLGSGSHAGWVQLLAGGWLWAVRVGPASIEARDRPVSDLAKLLSDTLQAPVLDQTGLTGSFDYTLTWQAPAPGAATDPQAVAKALADQLGLQLQSAPVTMDVIDVVRLKPPQEARAHG